MEDDGVIFMVIVLIALAFLGGCCAAKSYYRTEINNRGYASYNVTTSGAKSWDWIDHEPTEIEVNK